MNDILSWLSQNAVAVSILLVLIPATLAFAKNLELRNKQLQHRRFVIYHQLIRELVQGDSPEATPMLDRQIAIVFELRHFPEYFELTQRLLEGLEQAWAKPRILTEIGLTIDYIAQRGFPRQARPGPAPSPPSGDVSAR